MRSKREKALEAAHKDPALPKINPLVAPAHGKRKRGRQPGTCSHMPTDELRAIVEKCCASRWTVADIARLLNVSDETVRKYYKAELESGRQKCVYRVEAAVYQVATDPTHRDFATMAKMFLKSQAGWTETSRVEHTGADGGAIQAQVAVANVLDSTKLTREQRDNLREILAAASRPTQLIEHEPQDAVVEEIEDEEVEEDG